MKIKFNEVIRNEFRNNEVIREKISDDEFEDLTLKKVAINSLMMEDEESKSNGDIKFKRYDLALRIKKEAESCEVTVEELALIKKCIGRVYTTGVVGYVYQLIESSHE